MDVLRTKAELSDWLTGRGSHPRTLVPTMGALHRGHADLFDIARKTSGDGDVLATIFVNPTQFGPREDFQAYPRRLEEDLAVCADRGVDAVFAPNDGEMYSEDASTTVSENELSTRLCGASRPGHFDGVCTVVAKLFNLTRPRIAVFGEKDFQQLAIVRRLVRDLNFRIDIVSGLTAREDDGLALSSRNVYLSRQERRQAPAIFRSLTRVALEIAEGNFGSPSEARKRAAADIEAAPDSRIDYVEIVDSDTLEPLTDFESGEPRLMAAVYFGNTRLIDNVGIPKDVQPRQKIRDAANGSF